MLLVQKSGFVARSGRGRAKRLNVLVQKSEFEAGNGRERAGRRNVLVQKSGAARDDG